MLLRIIPAICAIAFCLIAGTATAQPAPSPPVMPRQAIQDVLIEKTVVDFNKTPLTDALDYFRDRLKVDIQVDYPALNSANPSIDPSRVLVTLHMESIPVRTALKTILADHNLTYIVQDGAIWITTPEAADRTMLVNVYNVRDLAGHGGEFGDSTATDQLIDVITGTIAPQSWTKNGGLGSVQSFASDGINVLVIAQRYDVQEEISKLLDELRTVAGPPIPNP